jgi:hypothetical protein
MDSLNDILAHKDFDEPAEATVIKAYVHEQFNEAVAVTIREREIIITARSAALANTLRLRTLDLRRLLGGDKRRLVFRIGR